MEKTESISDERLAGMHKYCTRDARAWTLSNEDVLLLVSELQERRAANSDGGVEPLKWAKENSRWIAPIFFGLYYRIHETPSGKFLLRDPLGGPEAFDSLEAAQEAGRVDYERRIRSTLANPPAKALDGIAVTDEMVERALASVEGEPDLYISKGAMRWALEAALK